MSFSSFYRRFTPYLIRKTLNKIFALTKNSRKKIRWEEYKSKILKYYEHHQEICENNKDIAIAIDYLKTNPIFFYPYLFSLPYFKRKYTLAWDKVNKMYFVVVDGKKKMYLNKSRDRYHHENYCKSIFMEQDPSSPHRYLTDDFTISPGATIIDAGGAEGLFTLLVIDKVRKAYIIEPDLGWYEALITTFAPWKDKVEIIPKFLSNTCTEQTVTVDSLYKKDDRINFFKADIEGFELNALEGAITFLKAEKKIQMIVCTYHKEEDVNILPEFVSKYGFSYQFSDKYMIPLNEAPEYFKPPYFRRVLMKARK